MKRNYQKLLIQLIVLAVFPAVLLLGEYIYNGYIGEQLPDAELYWSIAENLKENGVFLQTARNDVNFVVPPGVPFILSILRLIGFRINGIIAVQFVLFGVSALLLYCAEISLMDHVLPVCPCVLLLAFVRNRIWLGNIYIEHYYVFFLCAIIRIGMIEQIKIKHLIMQNFLAFFAFLTRPVLVVVYLPILAYTLGRLVKENSRQAFSKAFVLVAVPVLVLIGNMKINELATGEKILLESYSGSDLYWASLPDTSADYRDIDSPKDDLYLEISEMNISTYQKSILYTQYARQNMKNIRFYINAVKKLFNIFVVAYAYTTPIFVAGMIYLMVNGKRKKVVFALVCETVVLAVVTSFAVPILRYTIVVFPFAAFFASGFYQMIKDMYVRTNSYRGLRNAD